MLFSGPDTRELRWTCPDCGFIETEIVPMPKQARNEPSRIEVIELHCDDCDRKRMGLSPAWLKSAEPKPVNRVFGKVAAPDGP